MKILVMINERLTIMDIKIEDIKTYTKSAPGGAVMVVSNDTGANTTLCKYNTMEEANEEIEAIWEDITINNKTYYRFKNTYMENRIMEKLIGE